MNGAHHEDGRGIKQMSIGSIDDVEAIKGANASNAAAPLKDPVVTEAMTEGSRPTAADKEATKVAYVSDADKFLKDPDVAKATTKD